MPLGRKGEHSTSGCSHIRLCFNPTEHAAEAGYHRPTFQQRAAAPTTQGREPHILELESSDPSIFPAPLILPGDDLSLDSKYPPQSVRAWAREKDRNKVTPERRTIYVAAPPDVAPDFAVIRSWSCPAAKLVDRPMPIQSPNVHDIVQYLSSFYCGLPVKLLESPLLQFTEWDGDDGARPRSKGLGKPRPKTKDRNEARQYIGLSTSSESIRIRTRSSRSPAFQQQLNLDDLLDVAISILPDDAYALLLLVEHDLYEDEEDEFCCGRAYGGSRVTVVSTARYHPALDAEQGVSRDHAWPASHCEKYLKTCCARADAEETRTLPRRPKVKRGPEKKSPESRANAVASEGIQAIGEREVELSPMRAAVQAHIINPSFDSASVLRGLWLGRVCKTSSHELGHCFGIDHCVYYACIMQGSASLAEDARQPPYLCPVDEAKLTAATGIGGQERRAKMIEFCESDSNKDINLFKAFAAWLRGRIEA
jgi:archaemetzincin